MPPRGGARARRRRRMGPLNLKGNRENPWHRSLRPSAIATPSFCRRLPSRAWRSPFPSCQRLRSGESSDSCREDSCSWLTSSPSMALVLMLRPHLLQPPDALAKRFLLLSQGYFLTAGLFSGTLHQTPVLLDPVRSCYLFRSIVAEDGACCDSLASPTSWRQRLTTRFPMGLERPSRSDFMPKPVLRVDLSFPLDRPCRKSKGDFLR